jgi:hypothetical protein
LRLLCLGRFFDRSDDSDGVNVYPQACIRLQHLQVLVRSSMGLNSNDENFRTCMNGVDFNEGTPTLSFGGDRLGFAQASRERLNDLVRCPVAAQKVLRISSYGFVV